MRTMTWALALRPFSSPIEAVSEIAIEISQSVSSRAYVASIPEKFSRAEIKSLRIRPMRSTSVTMPVEMNVAQTLTASAANSGDESAANAGVKAELIWA